MRKWGGGGGEREKVHCMYIQRVDGELEHRERDNVYTHTLYICTYMHVETRERERGGRQGERMSASHLLQTGSPHLAHDHWHQCC